MSNDTEILLMKIERQVSRICKALEDKGNDDANEHYLREHILDFLQRNFPEYKEAAAAKKWFDSYIQDSEVWNVGMNSRIRDNALEIVPVPREAAYSIFELGWRSAMTTLRSKVQS